MTDPRGPSGPQTLTKRQAEALEALQKFQAAHGYPPTRAELGRLLGV
ncbi:MAG: LexA family protein, partial [Planctomycetota bacterium]